MSEVEDKVAEVIRSGFALDATCDRIAVEAIRAYEAHKETTFDPTAQLGGVIPPPSAVPEEIAEVVKELRGACVDWSGEPIVNESTPRYEVHCGLLRRAADLLERQSQEIAQYESTLDRIDEMMERTGPRPLSSSEP